MPRAHVLIVDDNHDFADSLADILIACGHTVTLAFSGEEAVSKSQEADFDVTLMDVRLPAMNGVESFLEIRKSKPDARVIMITGYSVEELLDQALENGAWAVLHKPFDPDELVGMLKQIEPAGVLVADDDPDVVESIRDLLEGRGHSVYIAYDGEEAVRKVRSNGINVLILDLRMPILGGLEVYRELERTGHAVPTIIITGFANEEAEAVDTLRSLSVKDVLVKPFDPGRLVRMVDALVCVAHS